jgi:acyl dehydratase
MPVTTLYLDDFAPGQRFDLGTFTLTADEIVAFARAYDPQPFHLSEEGGRASPYGGLIASGWHTCAVTMRRLADGLLARTPGMGSPGLDELRWLGPVRPGITYSVDLEVTQVRPSSSRPDRGAIITRIEVKAPDGAVVMRWTSAIIIGRRPTAAA